MNGGEMLGEPIQRFADVLENELKYNNKIEEYKYDQYNL